MVNRERLKRNRVSMECNTGIVLLKQTILALFFSFLLMNMIAFLYNHDPQWLPREGGPTKGVYAPGHFVFKSDEGIGYAHIDENGYVNADTNIGMNYVLILGKSHTNGTEVFQGSRYVDILDEKLREHSGRRAYCIASGASTFADLLSGFDALVDEFPNSSAIVIEMTNLDSPDEYLKITNPRTWNETMGAKYLFEHQTIKQQVIGFVKEYFPLIAYYINFKFPKLKCFDSNAFFQASGYIEKKEDECVEDDIYVDKLEKNLDFALQQIRSEYSGDIIVLYHPNVVVEKSGELSIKEMRDYEILEKCCNTNNIYICNAGEAFIEGYDHDYSVPYGFWNTSMSKGHLNANGHRVIADLLYSEYFKGDE